MLYIAAQFLQVSSTVAIRTFCMVSRPELSILLDQCILYKTTTTKQTKNHQKNNKTKNKNKKPATKKEVKNKNEKKAIANLLKGKEQT